MTADKQMVASKEQLTGNEKCMAVGPWYCLIDYVEIRFSSAEGLGQNFKHGLVGPAKLKLGLGSWWQVFVVLVVLCCCYGCCCLYLILPASAFVQLHTCFGRYGPAPIINHHNTRYGDLPRQIQTRTSFMFWIT